MISYIKDPKVIEFIRGHLDDDPESLILSRDKYPEIPISFVAVQIKARQKSGHKIPFILEHPEFVFPSLKSFEQSSSKTTADYKAGLFMGKSMLDLSGGLGIDAIAFNDHFDHVVHVEKDPQIHEAAVHNFSVLGKNIECQQTTAEEFLSSDGRKFDLVYIDPARRDEGGKRVFLLEDSEPNIIELLPEIFEHTSDILLKAAPILDIRSVIQKLPVKTGYVIAVNNEVKELLFHMEKDSKAEPYIHTVNLKKSEKDEFEFTFGEEAKSNPITGLPQTYLYEPNAAILKAGAFKSIAKVYNLTKLHEHTHLYTSEVLVEDFPGRTFQILDQVKAEKKKIREKIPDMKANLTVRNFPLSVDELRKKTGLKVGGKLFIFAVKTIDDRNSLLITEKIQDLPDM